MTFLMCPLLCFLRHPLWTLRLYISSAFSVSMSKNRMFSGDG
jgi:hypothetical protein